MTHVEALEEYVRRLNTHTWEQVAPRLAEDVVMIFTEGTFVGKEAVGNAIRKTFALIEDEEYSTSEVRWSVESDTFAVCRYEFRWKGRIGGREVSGGGRGTSVLVKREGNWLITHEHLGPYPKSG